MTTDAWLGRLDRALGNDRRATLVVLAVGVALFLPGLGATGLWDCWEPHYAEVARSMLARDDLVHPYWGTAYFFSKPVLPMWLMALGLWLVGADAGPPHAPLGELASWGARMPSALLAIATMWAVYRIGRRLGQGIGRDAGSAIGRDFGRPDDHVASAEGDARARTLGVLAALILGTSPQFIFIGKQAMVDMPLVAFVTLALMHLLEARFGSESPASWGSRALAVVGLLAALVPQGLILAEALPSVAFVVLVALALVALLLIARGSRRDLHRAGFAFFLGLAALSKGLAPLALLGPPILLYAALTRSLRPWLAGAPLVLVVFALVAAPWFVTMTGFEGLDDQEMTFTERFWLFDNLERVSVGVIGDRGGFTYYLEQLGYALFPWVALLPGAFAALRRPLSSRFVLVALSTLWCILFFTLMETKFHHYIFPALPGIALVLGFGVAESDSETNPSSTAKVVAIIVLAVVFRDLVVSPSNIVNLAIYKYERPYPPEFADSARVFLAALGAASVLALLSGRGLLARLPRVPPVAVLVFAGLVQGIWLSHFHFVALSPHWSQAGLFATYFRERRGDEPIYSYKLNWRGETFYSRNTVIPVIWDEAEARMRAFVDAPGREFIVTERATYDDLVKALSEPARARVRLIDDSSVKYGLYVVE